MFCMKCGTAMKEGERFCPQCGQPAGVRPDQPVQTDAPAPSPLIPARPVAAPNASYASLYNLRCPGCGGRDHAVVGVKGAFGKAMGTSLAFGAIGNMVAGSSASKNFATEPIEYKCNACAHKFQALPQAAETEELLSAPCAVNLERVSSFVGAFVPQIVYLNGEKMGPAGNGKTISMITNVRYNTIFVTDHHGLAFKDVMRFEAQPLSAVNLRFKRKFLR